MKKHNYKMTIIVPSYNNGQYISQALDSILQQKVNFDYQIIVTDDCSKDNSVEIIAQYEKKYHPRILAIYSDQNCKLFRNVLKALERMDSEYYCLLDPDDYWSDMDWLQKGVDFLDEHQDYTIYGANEYKLFNDGTSEIGYQRPGITTVTSTYDDFLMNKELLSNTLASIYRNVYFTDGVPEEYRQLAGSQYEETSRADTFRNLLHLRRGKAYFVNECIGYYRYHGNGLASAYSMGEKVMRAAFAHIGYYEYFGREYVEKYFVLIKKLYIRAIKEYYLVLVSGNIPELSEQYMQHAKIVSKWLQEHDMPSVYNRKPFSLRKYSEIGKKQTVIWGTGSAAYKIIERYGIPINEDTFFVDNNTAKQGKEFMGREIKAPAAIRDNRDCLVIIANSYYNEIIEQIKSEALCDEDRIINIYDYKEHWLE